MSKRYKKLQILEYFNLLENTKQGYVILLVISTAFPVSGRFKLFFPKTLTSYVLLILSKVEMPTYSQTHLTLFTQFHRQIGLIALKHIKNMSINRISKSFDICVCQSFSHWRTYEVMPSQQRNVCTRRRNTSKSRN